MRLVRQRLALLRRNTRETEYAMNNNKKKKSCHLEIHFAKEKKKRKAHHPEQHRGWAEATQTHAPEHADLRNDVVPVSGRLQFIRQQMMQLLAHLNNTSCHRANVSTPFLK
jgi:hypothetical protein